MTDAQQAEYINQSDWIAYKNPRVHTVAQYKIVDDQNIGSGFQMGLRLFATGAPKPAYVAYRLPIWVSGKGANVTVYGQVRPAENGTAQTVDIQNAASAGAAFKTVQTVPVTSANGTFTAAGAQLRRQLAPDLERAHVAPGRGLAQVRAALAFLAVIAAVLVRRRGAGPGRRLRARAWRTRACCSTTSTSPATRWSALERARRRRRPHPRALVGDRARRRRDQDAVRLQRRPTPTIPRYRWATPRHRGRDGARRRACG